MWEYWGHKKTKDAKGRAPSQDLKSSLRTSLSLKTDQGLSAVAEETVVPNVEGTADAGIGLTDTELSAAHIYFKDLKLLAHDNSEDSGEDESIEQESGELASLQHQPSFAMSDGSSPGADLSPSMTSMHATSRRRKMVDRQKLVIILVGLPARGKTFISNKIMCYFNWLGHPTRHFNVGSYRRHQSSPGEVQDASFFDPANVEGAAARHRALLAALEDMEAWLESDKSQVAIFDATNSTTERRNFLRDRLHGRFEYMFMESVCYDKEVLEKNYRLKMKFSPDYKGVDMEHALTDFKERIAKYESVYETITDRTMHYVKLIDMVTGRGHMDVNRISGYIPGKMVFFLMQICKALGRPRRIWLTRHGQSEFNVLGKIGGNSCLSTRGAAYAALLPEVLRSRVPKMGSKRGNRPVPVAVWTSTLERTIATASGLPYPKVQWKALDEIQAGVCDGMTYREIREQMPAEHVARCSDKLRYRYPSGESYMDVIQRLEPVVIEAEREKECICIVAHQAVLRALYGYFMNRPLEEVPTLDIPLHTLIELAPKADGTMAETRFHVDVDRALREIGWEDLDGALEAAAAAASRSSLDSEDESTKYMQFRVGSYHSEDPSLLSDRILPMPGTSPGNLNKEGSGLVRRSLSMAELAKAEVVTIASITDQDDDHIGRSA